MLLFYPLKSYRHSALRDSCWNKCHLWRFAST